MTEYVTKVRLKDGGDTLEIAAGGKATIGAGGKLTSVSGGIEIGGVTILVGAGAPNVAAPVGSLYLRTDPADQQTVLYVKHGAENANWKAVTAAS